MGWPPSTVVPSSSSPYLTLDQDGHSIHVQFNSITLFAMYLIPTRLVAPIPFPSLPFRRNTLRRCMPAAPALGMDGCIKPRLCMGDPRGFFFGKKHGTVRYSPPKVVLLGNCIVDFFPTCNANGGRATADPAVYLTLGGPWVDTIRYGKLGKVGSWKWWKNTIPMRLPYFYIPSFGLVGG